MKTLDLNAYGVEEMNVNEMENENGGFGWINLIAEFCTHGIDTWIAYPTANGNILVS